MRLRWYQTNALDDLDDGWTFGHKCQVLRMGTGTGKSATSAAAVREHNGGSLMMAHRGEIVAQLALALAREGVRHRVIGPDSLSRLCRAYQIDELGTHYVDPSARTAVASVQTMAAIKGENPFLRQIGFVVADEFHHFTTGGQFGKVLEMLPTTARVLGPTACTQRTDGKGLGRHADGYADHLVLGPPESVMMEQGFLCEYRIFAPPTTFDRESLHLNSVGEFKADEVKRQAQRSTIFGDSVSHYVTHTPGQLALQFCDSLENAVLVMERFRAAGVSSEVLSGKTHPDTRRAILKRFAKREVTHIASVSLIDEGFDCPAVEVVLDTAATTSLNRFRQRFGRGWRPAPGKVFRYFDFVGNVKQHGLPDAYRQWSLDRRERRGSNAPNDVIPVTTCTQCLATYERVLDCCPYCAAVRPVPVRGGPQQVDGVLQELDAETLARMRAAHDHLRAGPTFPMGATPAIVGKLRKDWRNRMERLTGAEQAVALWNGWQVQILGRSETEAQRRFFLRYGVDVFSAQSDTAVETQVRAELAAHGIIDATVNNHEGDE